MTSPFVSNTALFRSVSGPLRVKFSICGWILSKTVAPSVRVSAVREPPVTVVMPLTSRLPILLVVFFKFRLPLILLFSSPSAPRLRLPSSTAKSAADSEETVTAESLKDAEPPKMAFLASKLPPETFVSPKTTMEPILDFIFSSRMKPPIMLGPYFSSNRFSDTKMPSLKCRFEDEVDELI